MAKELQIAIEAYGVVDAAWRAIMAEAHTDNQQLFAWRVRRRIDERIAELTGMDVV